MKIGIDTFACNAGISGVGVYLKQILRRIPPSGALYELFGWEFDRYAYSEAGEKGINFVARCRFNGRTANSVWHMVRYKKFALSRGYNACFFPAAHRRLPSDSHCPTIGTIHDMAAYWGTNKTRAHLGAVLRLMLPDSLRKLDRIIAVSNWVRQELIDVAHVKESRIDVVPNGVDLDAYRVRSGDSDNADVNTPLSFKRPYIFYAGRLDHPIKNHTGLIKAFEIFRERTKFPHRLVFAGSDDNGADKIKQAAFSSRYRADIFFTGPFPSDSLPNLYSSADMVVIPSFYEGFGQCVIEAMAAGVPVACARAASLPETAEHAALYFDPYDAEDMADRMVTLATDHEIAEQCRAAGILRAKDFSWDICAARTLRIIQDMASQQ